MDLTLLSTEPVIVTDNNVLVDLQELECLHLLFETFGKVIIPKAIIEEEITDEIRDSLNKFDYEVAIIEDSGFEMYFQLVQNATLVNLSDIDRITISIALQVRGVCITNDKAARKACAYYDVKCSGTLGILGASYKKGIITKEGCIRLCRLLYTGTSSFITKKIVEEFIRNL